MPDHRAFQQPAQEEDLDVNSFICAAGNADFSNGHGPELAVPNMVLSDEMVIEGTPSEQASSPKKLTPGKIAVLAVCGLFAVGGVVSSFIVEEGSKGVALAKPGPAASPSPQAIPPAELNLPPGLAAPEPQAHIAPTLQTNPPQVDKPSLPAPSPTSTAQPGPSAPTQNLSVPSALTSGQPSPSSASAPQPHTAEPRPNQLATPSVVATPTTPEAAVEAKSNPITAQVAEAKAAPSAAQVKASPKVAEDPAKPAPAAKPVANSQSSAKPAPVAIQKSASAAIPPKAPAQPATQLAKPSPAKPPVKEPVEKDSSSNGESVKRLVTVSADAFGVVNMMDGAIILENKKTNSPQKFSVGDKLPTGEQIIKIDPRSMTLVTDRSVIRIN